jgi:PKD domain-containing protein
MKQWPKTAVAIGCVLVVLLALGAAQVFASANVLVMPDRDAFMGQTIVVWGNTLKANGTAFTLDFGDASAPVSGPVADQSYIAATHVYSTAGTFTVTLTVGGESETAKVTVWDPGTIDAFQTRGLKVNMAIEDGLRYLYVNQISRAANFTTNKTFWYNTGSDDHSLHYSALALLSFENQGHAVTNDPLKDIYQPVVQRGFNGLVDRLVIITLDCGPPGDTAGNPCVNVPTDGNQNKGLSSTGNNGYATGTITAAIATAAGIAPARTVDAGLGAANGNFVAGKTYAEILQRLSNTAVWGQADPTCGNVNRGGWIYGLHQCAADGSTAGWEFLGLLDAGASGATVPAFAKTEAAFALNAGLNNDGSLDYRADGNPATLGSNVAKTGVGLQGLAFIGVPGGDARVTAAEGYITRNWNAQVDPLDFTCFNGSPTHTNKGCGYAMFNVFKGLRLYGISTLPGIGRAAGPGPIPADDWYADYVDNLLTNQQGATTTAGGNWGPPSMGWSCCDDDNTIGITSLAELILAPVAFVQPSALALAPLSATNPPGTSHTVTATATTAGGSPVPGATVTFTVISGPNAGVTGSSVTNASGQATFTYTDPAGVTGTDTIRANIGALQSNLVSKTWGSGAPNISVGATGNNTRVADTFSVEVRLRNAGGTQADHVTITSVRPLAPVTYIGPALPKDEGSLAAGTSVNETLQFNVTGVATGSKVGFGVRGTFIDPDGKTYSFSAIISVTLIAP